MPGKAKQMKGIKSNRLREYVVCNKGIGDREDEAVAGALFG